VKTTLPVSKTEDTTSLPEEGTWKPLKFAMKTGDIISKEVEEKCHIFCPVLTEIFV
jgi:hypothetical protein